MARERAVGEELRVRKAATFIATIGVVVGGAASASAAAPPMPRLLWLDVSSSFAVRPATLSLAAGQFVISGPGVPTAAFRAGRLRRIHWTHWTSTQASGAGLMWVDNCVPSCPSGRVRSASVTIMASGVLSGRYTHLLLAYRSGRRQISDWRTLARVPGLLRPIYQWTHGGRLPGVSTGPARTVTQTSAALSGTVNPHGQWTTYYFEYGTTRSYGSTTAGRTAGTGARGVHVRANLSGLTGGLTPTTTYHYRLYARNATGIAYGPDRTFTVLIGVQQLNANRAVATYGAMQRYFYAASVYRGDRSSLYAENYPPSGLHYSYLWPFSRALAGTITLAGIPPALLGGVSYQSDVSDRLTGVSRYWESNASGNGYAAYPTAPYGNGGDRFYDDDAWVGLATAQNYALSGDPASLAVAQNVFHFVYPGGWAASASFDPGGVYWVQQGTGVGAGNHDRTTTSNAPNAETALLLENLDPANAATYDTGASAMYEWVNHYLYNVNINPTDPAAPNPNYTSSEPPLVFDKVTGANAIDRTLYTYNQGTMIAANVREYQKTGNTAYLSDAEAIANTALTTFNEAYYISHSAAFNAIFFRGLLVLYSVTSDANLQANIIHAIQTYADDAWSHHRNASGLFNFSPSPGNGYQLLDQGAMLQVYAMLAWDASDYSKLP
jgi:hypothetical protein